MKVNSSIIFSDEKNIGWIEVDYIPQSNLYVISNNENFITVTTINDFISFFKYNTKYDPKSYQMIYNILEKNDNSETFLKFSNLILNKKSFQKNKIKYKIIKSTDFIYEK